MTQRLQIPLKGLACIPLLTEVGVEVGVEDGVLVGVLVGVFRQEKAAK